MTPDAGDARDGAAEEPQPSPGATEGPGPRPRIEQSPDGFLEVFSSDSFASMGKGRSSKADSRSLAELGASVMKAASEERSRPPESGAEEPAPPDEIPATLSDSPPDEPPETPPTRSRSRWAAVIVMALLLLAAGTGFLQSDLGESSSSPNSEAVTELSGAPPAVDEPLDVVPADPTPSPVPTPEPVVAAPAPIPEPTPTATVAPAPVPTVAPAPESLHIGNLVPLVVELGQGTKVKVSVDVYVHDSAHNPIAGASVSGQWTGALGTTSCTTAATSFCTLQTNAVGVPGSVTFTVTGITYNGIAYQPALNHDAGGDSNGTSITVVF